MKLVAVDPGKSSGWAIFEDGVLAMCGAGAPYWISCASSDDDVPVDYLVIERPEIYRGSKVNPNNLITLAIEAGWWYGRVKADTVMWVAPKKWKGQLPKTKKLENYAVFKRLKPKNVPYMAGYTKKQQFDIVDAIGIGQWAMEHML